MDLIANAFAFSCGITTLAFFVVGALKGQYVEQSWYRSGLETTLVGGAAALQAYGFGALLRNLVAV